MLWVSLDEYRRLTPEERKHWNVGIDLTRGFNDWRQDYQLDQKDYEEYIQEMSIGGPAYKVPQ